MTRIFPNWEEAVAKIDQRSSADVSTNSRIPTFYRGTFQLSQSAKILDTFLKLDGWSKGVAFINGFNLGRYWPIMGPQVTLYTPAHLFKPYPQQNSLILFELERSPDNGARNVRFVKEHILNGTTPYGQ